MGWMREPLWASVFCSAHKANHPHRPITNPVVRIPLPMWKLLGFNKIDFLPFCNVLIPFKLSVNYAWNSETNTPTYIHLSGEYTKCSEKYFFSERQLQTGSFCWRERILEGCFRCFYELYSYSRKAPSKEVRDRVTLISPRVILRP